HTALLNLVATNRCDLSCWYCFFFSERAGYVYEPSIEHIRFMLEAARKQKPIPAIAVQITGGEPLLRDDIIEIIRIARELGYEHIQLNTTGIRFAYEPELAVKVREAGVNTIYMSFDGVTPITNPKNHWEIPYILDAFRKAGLGAVLVPTVIKGVNDHEVTKMIYFGLKHNDIVRGVNFQPVSLVGRIPKHEREKLRITIPDILKRVEEDTNGEVLMDDWYTVPFTIPISEFIEAMTGKPQFTMSNHFACGVATYLFQDRKTGKIVPLPRFIDVEAFVNYLKELTEYIRKGGSKKLAIVKLMAKLGKFIIWEHTPEQLRKRKRIYWMLFNIFARHNYSALGEFHLNTLFVGMMHFQDEYNYDVARIQRCDIHYVGPDGRLIPFCTFNVFPEMYRDRLQKIYSIPLKKYLEMKGLKSMAEEKYRRNIKKLESTELYKKTYEGFWDPSKLTYEEKRRISIRFGIPVIEE
ncbi:MAG: radical SAM protein, partial [Thermoprotei archaeon]